MPHCWMRRQQGYNYKQEWEGNWKGRDERLSLWLKDMPPDLQLFGWMRSLAQFGCVLSGDQIIYTVLTR